MDDNTVEMTVRVTAKALVALEKVVKDHGNATCRGEYGTAYFITIDEVHSCDTGRTPTTPASYEVKLSLDLKAEEGGFPISRLHKVLGALGVFKMDV